MIGLTWQHKEVESFKTWTESSYREAIKENPNVFKLPALVRVYSQNIRLYGISGAILERIESNGTMLKLHLKTLHDGKKVVLPFDDKVALDEVLF